MIDKVTPVAGSGTLPISVIVAYELVAVLEGRRAESRVAYDRFFDLWKDADANLPVLLDARREYAKLASN